MKLNLHWSVCQRGRSLAELDHNRLCLMFIVYDTSSSLGCLGFSVLGCNKESSRWVWGRYPQGDMLRPFSPSRANSVTRKSRPLSTLSLALRV